VRFAYRLAESTKAACLHGGARAVALLGIHHAPAADLIPSTTMSLAPAVRTRGPCGLRSRRRSALLLGLVPGRQQEDVMVRPRGRSDPLGRVAFSGAGRAG